MAKLSKFGAAFAAARKGGAKEFDFGGKKFNTKMKADAPAKKKSTLPKTAIIGPSRSSAISGMTKKPSFSALTEAGQKPAFSSGPSKRGGGPKIAMSKANMDKRKGSIGIKAPVETGRPKYKLPKI